MAAVTVALARTTPSSIPLPLIGLLLGFLRLLSELSSFGDNAGLVGVLSGLLGGEAAKLGEKSEKAEEKSDEKTAEPQTERRETRTFPFLLQLGEDILDILLSLGVDNWGLLFFGHCCELYRIVAEAAKLGEKSEKAEEKSDEKTAEPQTERREICTGSSVTSWVEGSNLALFWRGPRLPRPSRWKVRVSRLSVWGSAVFSSVQIRKQV
jgi:hypothetical protein